MISPSASSSSLAQGSPSSPSSSTSFASPTSAVSTTSSITSSMMSISPSDDRRPDTPTARGAALPPASAVPTLHMPVPSRDHEKIKHHHHHLFARAHSPFRSSRSRKSSPPPAEERAERAPLTRGRSSSLPPAMSRSSAAHEAAAASIQRPGSAAVRAEYPTEQELFTQYDRYGHQMDATRQVSGFKVHMPTLGYGSSNSTALASENWGAPPVYV